MRNPNLEIRNKPEIRTTQIWCGFRISDFEFVSDFEIRISDLRPPHSKIDHFSATMRRLAVPTGVRRLTVVNNTPTRKDRTMKSTLATLATLFVVGAAQANVTITGQGKVTYTPN